MTTTIPFGNIFKKFNPYFLPDIDDLDDTSEIDTDICTRHELRI